MAKLLSIPITAPPSTVKVLVDFYDDNHRQLLMQSAASSLLSSAQLPSAIEISTVDFLTYYLFYKKRPGTPGFSSYSEVRKKFLNALVEFDGIVDFRNNSVGLISKAGMNSGTTERLGEAISLTVVSKLHGLVEADWAKIDETSRRRTLDYEYAASDKKLIIKTEAKGSASNDNDKQSSLSKAKTSIENKKIAERKASGGSSKALLYGTIGVLDDRQNSVARCWLLDPPLSFDASPEQFRIIARLSAIADLLSFISPRSAVTTALRNRVNALKSLDNINELDGVALVKGNGKEFESSSFTGFGERNPWFWNKSYVTDGPAGGQVIALDNSALLFIGIQEELLLLAISQSFGSISEFKFPTGTVHKKIRCVVPSGRFKRKFSSILEDRIRVRQQGDYAAFDLDGNLHYSSGGLVFGILPIEERIGD